MTSPSSPQTFMARKYLSLKQVRMVYLMVFLIRIAVPLLGPLGEEMT